MAQATWIVLITLFFLFYGFLEKRVVRTRFLSHSVVSVTDPLQTDDDVCVNIVAYKSIWTIIKIIFTCIFYIKCFKISMFVDNFV